jgi:hypothetical protein
VLLFLTEVSEKEGKSLSSLPAPLEVLFETWYVCLKRDPGERWKCKAQSLDPGEKATQDTHREAAA